MKPSSSAPETIVISRPHHENGEEEFARWQSEDEACFPAPLCTAIPPKRPNRQASVATGPPAHQLQQQQQEEKEESNNEAKKEATKEAPPTIPRRRASNQEPSVAVAVPPKRPSRQKSVAIPELDVLDCMSFSSGSTQNNSISIERLEDSMSSHNYCFHESALSTDVGDLFSPV